MFARWLCPSGMKTSNAGSSPCTCWVPPSRITWATGSRWRRAGPGGLDGSSGGVYGWSLEPPPAWEQVLKRSHNAGTCWVLPCRSGCWCQTLGTFILQHCPGVYSLPSSSSGRSERKQRAFSDNLHYSLKICDFASELPATPKWVFVQNRHSCSGLGDTGWVNSTGSGLSLLRFAWALEQQSVSITHGWLSKGVLPRDLIAGPFHAVSCPLLYYRVQVCLKNLHLKNQPKTSSTR